MRTVVVSIIASALTVLGIQFVPTSVFFPDSNTFGTTITTINGSDTISSSRTTINNNFSALNTGKFELSDWYATTSATQLVKVGTITTGTWNATAVTVPYGGTGSTTLSSNQVLLGNGTGNVKTVSGYGVSGQFLQSNGNGAAPSWVTSSVDTTAAYSWTGLHTFGAGYLATASSTNNATTSIAASSVTNNALILNGVKYAFPSAQGSANNILANDGTGVISWSSVTKIAFATTSLSFNTAATTWSFASTTIPANTLANGGGVRIRAYINTLDMQTAVGNTMSCKYGGSTVATQGLNGSASTPNQFQGVVECVVYAHTTSAESGVMLIQLEQGNGAAGGTAKLGINAVAVGTAAVSTASNQTLELIYTAGDSNAGNGITVKYVTVEKIQ